MTGSGQRPVTPDDPRFRILDRVMWGARDTLQQLDHADRRAGFIRFHRDDPDLIERLRSNIAFISGSFSGFPVDSLLHVVLSALEET